MAKAALMVKSDEGVQGASAGRSVAGPGGLESWIGAGSLGLEIKFQGGEIDSSTLGTVSVAGGWGPQIPQSR